MARNCCKNAKSGTVCFRKPIDMSLNPDLALYYARYGLTTHEVDQEE